MMASAAAVCFDLDETLLRYNRPPEAVLASSFERCGVDPFFSAEDYYHVFDEHVEGAESIREIRAASFAQLAREHGRDPDIGAKVADAYSAERDHANVALYPGVESLLESMSREYPVALITNGPRESQAAKLAATDLEGWFDVVVYAGDEVPPKPRPEPFQRALSTLDVSPTEAVHVGNSLESDIRGAAGVGMTAVWVGEGDPSGDVAPDYRIDAVPELLDLPLFG